MTTLTSTDPRSPAVAREYGASCKLIDGVYYIGNGVTQEDFDAAAAGMTAAPLSDEQRAAYDRLQSEGYGR